MIREFIKMHTNASLAFKVYLLICWLLTLVYPVYVLIEKGVK